VAQSIFTSQVPAASQNDTTDYTIGTLWYSDVAGEATRSRWRFPSTLPTQTAIGLLYRYTNESTGTELARANFVNPVAGQWNLSELYPTPVTIDPFPAMYIWAVWTSDWYVFTSGFFTGNAVVNGNLTAPADDTVTPRRNGRGEVTAASPDYPGSFGPACYFADGVFEPTVQEGSPVGWQRKVNRHVTYLQAKTVGGNAAYVKRRPGTITALGAGALVDIRVGHHGETYTNVDRRTDPDANATGVYVSY